MGADLIEASVTDAETVNGALIAHEVTGVIHLTGQEGSGRVRRASAVVLPTDVATAIALLEAMAAAGVDRMVFSSSGLRRRTAPTSLRTRRHCPGPVRRSRSSSPSG